MTHFKAFRTPNLCTTTTSAERLGHYSIPKAMPSVRATSINAGLDQEMPGAAYLSAAMVAAQLQAGTITQAQIDAAVLRMLVPMFAVGLFDAPPGRSEPSGFDSKRAFRVSDEAMLETCGYYRLE